VAAASALLLLVFSARAAADGLDAAAATASPPAGEVSAPVQATPTPQAVASEPAEVAEPEASTSAESDPPATPSAAPPATPATHASTAHLPEPDDLPSPAASAKPNTLAVHNIPKGATGVPSTDPVAELTRTANRAPAKATAAIADSARSTVKAVDRVAPVDRVPALPDHPLQMASGALKMARSALPDGVLGIAVPEGVEDLRSPSGAPLEVGADALSPPATPAIPRTATAEPAGSLDKSQIRHLLDFAGIDSLPPVAPGLPTSSSASHPGLDPGGGDLGDVSAGPVNERFADLTPLDGNPPQPAPGSSQAGTAGAGGTSFIPIAALLALLALAAPAILRRLGEGPGFRPPTPFVCALERPG